MNTMRRARATSTGLILMVVTAAMSCAEAQPTPSSGDAASAETTQSDAQANDAASTDTTTTSSANPDATVKDATSPNTGGPDPDTTDTTDTGETDTSETDTGEPDTTTTDAAATDTLDGASVNDATVVDGQTPNPADVSSGDGSSAGSSKLEGKWVLAYLENTMYLFHKGLRYTYLCVEKNCEPFWKSVKAGDGKAIPNPNPYTFINGVLEINLFFGNKFSQKVAFTCGDNVLSYAATGGTLVRWRRPGYDISKCLP